MKWFSRCLDRIFSLFPKRKKCRQAYDVAVRVMNSYENWYENKYCLHFFINNIEVPLKKYELDLTYFNLGLR